MAGFTQVDVISQVLVLLGNGPIQNLSNPSSIVVAATQTYNLTYNDMLSKNMWRFAAVQTQLSQSTSSPVIPNMWQYIYQIPGDFLMTIRQWPQNYVFEIYAGMQFYSQLEGPLYLEYISSNTQIEQCSIAFVNALIYEIAATMALSSAQNTQYATYLRAQADIKLAQAQAKDSKDRPQTPLASSPVLNNRFVSWTASNGA